MKHFLTVLMLSFAIVGCTNKIINDSTIVHQELCKDRFENFYTAYAFKETYYGAMCPHGAQGKYHYIYFEYKNRTYQTLIGYDSHMHSEGQDFDHYNYYDGSEIRIEEHLQEYKLSPNQKFAADFGDTLNISGLYSCKYDTGQFIMGGLIFSVAELRKDFVDDDIARGYCEFLIGNWQMGYVDGHTTYNHIYSDTGPIRDDCLKFYNERFKSRNYCDSMLTKQGYSECMHNFIRNINPGLEFCGNLRNDTQVKYACLLNVSKRLDDINICYRIKSVMESGDCILHFAIEKNEMEMCNEIVDEYAKSKCYYKLAILNNKPANCFLIADSKSADSFSFKDTCLKELALKDLNASLCYPILYQFDRNICLSDVAGKTLELQLCSKIEIIKDSTLISSDDKGYCIRRIAEKMNNISLCYDIEYEYQKWLCLTSFARKTHNKALCQKITVEKLERDCLDTTL